MLNSRPLVPLSSDLDDLNVLTPSHFFDRWSVDYLNGLQQRNKWHFEKKNAKIGDMVIIKEDNLPSCQWSLVESNNIYPGKDSKSALWHAQGVLTNLCNLLTPSRKESEQGELSNK
ncbi:integrase catalytic domain-containing protein [Trichonephila clavipes]|nr:integrase catalytic domain-containing protein [Trichonephila clavipes]